MKSFCTFIVLGLLDMLIIPAVSGIVCMSDNRCRNVMTVAPDEEAYCQINFLGVGCCHTRKRPEHWTAWSNWGHCSATCGSGTRISTRTCTGSGSCLGQSSKTVTCYANPYQCPVDGHLEEWSDWSTCSQTCGSGIMTRSRACTPPQHGGAPCSRNTIERQQCVLKHCPVDGHLEDWSGWSTCSQTCGSGQRTRTRACVPPQYGGAPCSQNNQETEQCLLNHCPGMFCPVCDRGLTCTRYQTCTTAESCLIDPRNGTDSITRCVASDDCRDDTSNKVYCCHTMDCLSKRGLTLPAIPVSVWCQDKLDDCWSYSDAACSGVYESWARANCPYRCGYCPNFLPPCNDIDAKCPRYSNESCTSHRAYMKANCRKRCNECVYPGQNLKPNSPPEYAVVHSVSTTPIPTRKVSSSTPPPTTTASSGLVCPECDKSLNCRGSRACTFGEVCMLLQYRDDPFTVHCSKKQDCAFMKRNTPGVEIACCEDRQCITDITGEF